MSESHLFLICSLLLSVGVTRGDYVVYDVIIEGDNPEQSSTEPDPFPDLLDLINHGGPPILADFVESPDDEYDFTAPRDFVIILDRSQSVSAGNFDEGKHVMESLIQTSIVVHPDYTRIAFITFSGDVKVEFDSIKSGSLTGCEMFAPDGVWESVQFVPDQFGTSVSEALEKASEILSVGRLQRPGLYQDIFLLTDAEHFEIDDVITAHQLVVEDVNVYSVGIGGQLKEAILRNMSSQPASYYYHSAEVWLEMIQSLQVRTKTVKSDGRTAVSKSLCSSCEAGAGCYCENLRDSAPLCLCEAAFSPLGTRCVGCSEGTYKATFGNTTCTECPASNETEGVSSIVIEQCTPGTGWWSPVIIAYVAVNAVVVLTCIGGIIYIVRYKRRKRSRNQRTGESNPQTIYTQTYDSNQANGSRGYGQQIGTQVENGTAPIHSFLSPSRPPVQHKWSENSSDSGVVMDTPPTPGRNNVFTFNGVVLDESKLSGVREDDRNSLSSTSDIHESRETILAIRRQHENSLKETEAKPTPNTATKRPSKLKRWKRKFSGKQTTECKQKNEEEQPSVSNIVRMFEQNPPPLRMVIPSVSLTIPSLTAESRDSAYVEPDTPTEDDYGYMIPSPIVPYDNRRQHQMAGRSVSADPQMAHHFKTNNAHPKLKGASRSHEPSPGIRLPPQRPVSPTCQAHTNRQFVPTESPYNYHISLVDREENNNGHVPLRRRLDNQATLTPPEDSSRNSYIEIKDSIGALPVCSDAPLPSLQNPLFQGD